MAPFPDLRWIQMTLKWRKSGDIRRRLARLGGRTDRRMFYLAVETLFEEEVSLSDTQRALHPLVTQPKRLITVSVATAAFLFI